MKLEARAPGVLRVEHATTSVELTGRVFDRQPEDGGAAVLLPAVACMAIPSTSSGEGA